MVSMQRVVAFVLGLAIHSLCAAQDVTSPVESEPSEYSAVSIEARLKDIESNPDLDEETKKARKDLLEQALVQAREAAAWEAKLVEFQKSRLGSPERQEQLRNQLASAVQEAPITFPPEAGTAELEQAVAQRTAELEAAQAAAKKLDEDVSAWTLRRKEIPARIIEIRQALDELLLELDKGSPDDRNHLAERILGLQKRRALESEWSSLEEELANYDTREQELKLRRDLAALEISMREKALVAWRDRLKEVRTQEAEKAAQAARHAQREAARKHPLAKDVADLNAKLAEERAELAAKLGESERYSDELKQRTQSLKAEFEKIKKIINSVGLTPSLANRVRMELENLPSVRSLKRNIRDRRNEASQATVNSDLYATQHTELQLDLNGQVAAVLVQLGAPEGSTERAEVESTIRELLNTRIELLSGLKVDYEEYVELLTVQLPEAEETLLAQTEEYQAFLSERVLWIRSNAAVTLQTLKDGVAGLFAFLAYRGWVDVVNTLYGDLRANPLVFVSPLIGFLILLGTRPLLTYELVETGKEASKATLRTYAPTLRAFVITLLLAITGPLLFWFLAWRLVSQGGSDFVKAVGSSLQSATLSVFFLCLLREVCRRKGLGESHFGWQERALRLVRRNLFILALLAIPAVFVVAVLEIVPFTEPKGENLARLAFFVWTLAILYFTFRVLAPKRGSFAETIAKNPKGWLARFWWLWYPTALLLPIMLLIANLTGYYYTALQMAWRLRITALLIVSMLVVHALMERWILAAKRKLAIDRFRKWRAAQAEKREKEPGAGPEPETPVDEPIDLPTIGEQTRRLLNAATSLIMVIVLWATWIDVLPALNRLHEIQLWSVTAQVAAAGDGVGATVVDTRESITLADLFKAILVVAITVIAGRNLPGLLEISVLGWLPLDAGARYAATTVSRYLITVVGLVIAFATIGITWTTVQWLAAAITVGLGFGLQEIFANFVAGLILLFERPIRLGDTVTVGQTHGKVTRIRIRATTITDWDRKELIIPNKEFITGSFINWSLTDRLIRAVVRVGVAYGSDLELVCKLLTQVARANRRVVNDPPPGAFLVNFGESSIDFELRVHVESVDDLIVYHELYMAIEKAFRESGIQIPFPQRDMNIRILGMDQDVELPKVRFEAVKH